MKKEGGEPQGAQGAGNRAEGWGFSSPDSVLKTQMSRGAWGESICLGCGHDGLFFKCRFLMPQAMSHGALMVRTWRTLPEPPKDSGCRLPKLNSHPHLTGSLNFVYNSIAILTAVVNVQ
jgi:hypothetical protein